MKIKALTLFSILSISVLYVNAQESKLKSEKTSFLGTEFNYKVNNESLKNGPAYLTDSKTKNILIKGFYKNNLPSGNWYFYNQSGLEISYNYDQNKVLFIDTALFSKSNIIIKSDNNEVIEKASVPILLYPKDLFIKTIVEEFTKTTSSDSSELHLEIITNIFKSEKTNYAVKYFLNGKEKTLALKLNEQPLNIEWIPAMFNKEFVPSEIRMKVFLTGLKSTDNNSRRFRWDN